MDPKLASDFVKVANRLPHTPKPTPYTCKRCGKKYDRMNELLKHIKDEHPNSGRRKTKAQ